MYKVSPGMCMHVAHVYQIELLVVFILYSIPVLGFAPCKGDLWLTTMLPTPTQFAYLLCLLSLVSFDITNNKQNSSVCVKGVLYFWI